MLWLNSQAIDQEEKASVMASDGWTVLSTDDRKDIFL